jgi:hypothetical protein
MTSLNTESIQLKNEVPTASYDNKPSEPENTTITQNKNVSPSENSQSSGTETSQEDPNWRAFREARKRDRLEKEAAEKKALEKEAEVAALKAAMEAAFSKSAPAPQAYQQYYAMNSEPEETEEQRIERKVNELLAKKEEQYKREQQEYEIREYPNKIKREFPDFGQVCSQENLDYLDYHYPEVSRPLQRLQEGYDKWHDIYHAVKKLIPNHTNVKRDSVLADINSSKPKSISSIQLSNQGEKVRPSWQESESRRAENWARMQRTLKGLN